MLRRQWGRWVCGRQRNCNWAGEQCKLSWRSSSHLRLVDVCPRHLLKYFTILTRLIGLQSPPLSNHHRQGALTAIINIIFKNLFQVSVFFRPTLKKAQKKVEHVPSSWHLWVRDIWLLNFIHCASGLCTSRLFLYALDCNAMMHGPHRTTRYCSAQISFPVQNKHLTHP